MNVQVKQRHILLMLVVMFSSCASPQLQYPITEKKYKDDQISVQAAVNLAFSAYLKGCVDRSVQLHAPQSFQQCRADAQKHVKDNIIFIMDEDALKK